MARRIRWQIVIAGISALIILGLLSGLALSNTAVVEPLAGGNYSEALLTTPIQLLPLFNDPLADPTGRDIGMLLFDGLMRIGRDGLLEGALAKRWQVDQSGEVYTFRLHEDVKWHDGQPFTADDVVFTLRAIQDRRFDGDPTLANLWRNVIINRIDKYTIRCTLNAPFAPFLNAARTPILPAHLLSSIPIQQWATSPFARKPIGTGPYLLRELTSERALLERNTTYFAKHPFLEQIELRFLESPEAAISAVVRGDIQAMGADARAVPELNQIALPKTIRRMRLPMDEYAVLTFNLRKPPLNNQQLRQALAHALDKDALIAQTLNGQVVRLDTPILPQSWASHPSLSWYAYDSAAASQLLEKAGYPQGADGTRTRKGKPLILSLLTDDDPARLAAAQEIARQWQTLGIQVKVQQLESATLRQRLRKHDFVLALHSWARLGPDPDIFHLWHASQAKDGLNYAGLNDKAIDKYLTQGRTESTLSKRSKAYHAFQRRWIELAPSILLYQPLYVFASTEQLGGLGFEQVIGTNRALLIGQEDRYRTISEWFLNSSREIRGTLR